MTGFSFVSVRPPKSVENTDCTGPAFDTSIV
ncbi:uncharacterized protein METZ01_LOCUS137319, partial [marine metagenome]